MIGIIYNFLVIQMPSIVLQYLEHKAKLLIILHVAIYVTNIRN